MCLQFHTPKYDSAFREYPLKIPNRTIIPLVSDLHCQLGYSTGVFQALLLVVHVEFRAVD